MNNDHIYWLFSSSAQTISAFIAFLLAGFALVHTMMDSIQKNDDSLKEIHSELKRKHYNNVKCLAALTGCAIIMSLFTVYINGIRYLYINYLVIVSSVLSFLAIISGICFVISIINPDNYINIARDIYSRENKFVNNDKVKISSDNFFLEFVKLENSVRSLFNKNINKLVGNFPDNRQLSFNTMVKGLFNGELIDISIYSELIEVGKYRNLIFHGHMENVDAGILKTVIKLREMIEGFLVARA